MSAMDLQKDPFRDEAVIEISKNIQIPDPRDENNVVRSNITESYTQVPALICSGCYSDKTEIPTAPSIWVGGKNQ